MRRGSGRMTPAAAGEGGGGEGDGSGGGAGTAGRPLGAPVRKSSRSSATESGCAAMHAPTVETPPGDSVRKARRRARNGLPRPAGPSFSLAAAPFAQFAHRVHTLLHSALLVQAVVCICLQSPGAVCLRRRNGSRSSSFIRKRCFASLRQGARACHAPRRLTRRTAVRLGLGTVPEAERPEFEYFLLRIGTGPRLGAYSL